MRPREIIALAAQEIVMSHATPLLSAILRTIRSATLAVALLAVALPASGAGKTFRFANSTELLTMDPHGALVVLTQMIQGYAYEGLVRINKDSRFEPSLAESYE